MREEYRKKEEALVEQLRKRLEKNNAEHRRALEQIAQEQERLQQEQDKLYNQLQQEYLELQALYLGRPGRLEDMELIKKLQAVVLELRQRLAKEHSDKERIRKELQQMDQANRIFGKKGL